MISLISREMGEQRWWVCDHANMRTCATLMTEHIPLGATRLYTDAWRSAKLDLASLATAVIV
jgi:hypothetical protein